MFFLYRLLFYIFLPVIYVFVKINKDPKRYREHFGITFQKKDPIKETIWFHGDSIGEILAILPIIKKFDKTKFQIVITTITDTSSKIIENRLEEMIVHQYFPFEFSLWVKRFINHWNVKKVYFTESGLWPNVINECHKRNIPITLLNAKLSDKTFRNWSFFSFFSKPLFKKFSVVLAQSEKDKDRYLALGVEHVVVQPNLKYAASPLSHDENNFNDLKPVFLERKSVCAISTHPGEEGICVENHKKLKFLYPHLLTIIIPRHLNRVDALIKELQSDYPDLVFQRRTEDPKIHSHIDVYIVDTMGEVGLFCKLSSLNLFALTLLGGTFSNIGGHNPLEPLMLGCRLVIGPYRQNIRTLVEELKGDIILCDHNDDLFQIIQQELKNPTPSSDLSKKIEERRKTLNTLLESYVYL